MNLLLGEENILLSFKKRKLQISKSKKSLENIRSCVGAQQLKSQAAPTLLLLGWGCRSLLPPGLSWLRALQWDRDPLGRFLFHTPDA